MDVSVDWLNSFFDEPNTRETPSLNGLNPPISQLSEVTSTSTYGFIAPAKLLTTNTTHSSSKGNILLDGLNSTIEDLQTDFICKSPNPTDVDKNPFLTQSQQIQETKPDISIFNGKQSELIEALKRAQQFRILTSMDRQSLATAKELIQRLKGETTKNLIQTSLLERRKENHICPESIGLINGVVKSEPDGQDSDSGMILFVS